MAVTLVTTPGAANANSYCTEAEAVAYFDARLPLDPAWEDADDPTAALAMATRILEGFASAIRVLVAANGNIAAYYRTNRHWTGLPASTTQRLSWPRSGMFDQNGNAIPATVIPEQLKEAEAELAGQLLKADRTLDNDVILQGLTSVKAGSVALTFKQQFTKQLLPDAVLDLLLPGWLTDELVEPATAAFFDVVSRASVPWPPGDEVL
jgi:hypothetical protein